MNKNNNNLKAATKPKNSGRQRRKIVPPAIPSRNTQQYQDSKNQIVQSILSKQQKTRQRSVAAAYSTGQSSFAPAIMASRDQSRIIHRELIGSIVGSSAFTISTLNSYALNPGLSSTFPWLSTQAVGWEQYHFNKLRFCYYTRTGSQVPGSVMIIPDYDAADPAPSSEQIASAYEDVVEDAPWKDLECSLRVTAMHPDGPKKYIRNGSLASNLDIKTYDVGSLFVATADGTAVNWGKLWVEYDVILHTPQLPSSGFAPSRFQSLTSTSPTSTDLVGSVPVVVANSSSLFTIAGEVLTFLVAGSYWLNYLVVATTATATANPTISASGSFISWFGAAGPEAIGSGTTALIMVFAFNAAVGTTVTFNNTLVAGTQAELSVIGIPSNFG